MSGWLQSTVNLCFKSRNKIFPENGYSTDNAENMMFLFHKGPIQEGAFPVAAVVVPVILLILIAGIVAGIFIFKKVRGNMNMNHLPINHVEILLI